MRLSHPHCFTHLSLRKRQGGLWAGPAVGGPSCGRGLFRPAPAPNSGARATRASPLPAVRGPRCVLPRVLMAGKLVSLVPPLLLAAVGLAGLLLLCVPTQDVREPPALKVHALTAALGSSWPWG